MISFDRVLPELIRICHEDATREAAARYCIVRDVHGRIRMTIEPKGSTTASFTALEVTLSAALGMYFVLDPIHNRWE